MASFIDAAGKEVFIARTDARFSEVTARNVGNGFVRIRSPVERVTVQDVSVDGGYRVIENTAGLGQHDATVKGLLVERVRATRLKRGFARIRYNSSGGIFRDIVASGQIYNQEIPCGIAFSDTAHDFTLERCVMRGFSMDLGPDRYANGDGFSTELGNYGFRFLRCEAYDHSDGGFDLKSSGTFLDGCIAGGNKRNFRFWTTAQAYFLTSLTPIMRGGRAGPAHVFVAGKSAPVIEIERLTVHSETQAPLVVVEDGPATVVIASHDVRAPKGTPLFSGPAGSQVIWKSGPPTIG